MRFLVFCVLGILTCGCAPVWQEVNPPITFVTRGYGILLTIEQVNSSLVCKYEDMSKGKPCHFVSPRIFGMNTLPDSTLDLRSTYTRLAKIENNPLVEYDPLRAISTPAVYIVISNGEINRMAYVEKYLCKEFNDREWYQLKIKEEILANPVQVHEVKYANNKDHLLLLDKYNYYLISDPNAFYTNRKLWGQDNCGINQTEIFFLMKYKE